jgi:Tol biopolymer transport system component
MKRNGTLATCRDRPAVRYTSLLSALLPLLVACDGASNCGADPFAPGCYSAAQQDAPPQSLVFNSNRLGPLEIFTANADGSEWRRLTMNPGADIAPRWSPDGAMIVWAAMRLGQREIWVMNADGTGPRQLTQLNAAASMPDWSPDGSRIAFQARRGDMDENAWDIWLVNADGTGLQRLTSTASQVDPRWSPDGRQIAVRWMASSSDGSCRCLGTTALCPCAGSIGIMDADGSGLRVLPRVGTCDAGPAWSPDGRHIVFASYRDGSGGDRPHSRLMIMRADGGVARRLTAAGMLDEWYPSWSAATGRIYFTRAFRIYSLRPDGSDLRRVTAIQGADVFADSR